MKRFFVILSTITPLLGVSSLSAQDSAERSGRIPGGSTLAFLNFAPDARGAALGEAGVAQTPDANAAYWNPAKLAFNKEDFGATLSFAPWLGDITDDMFLAYLAGYKKLEKGGAIGLSLQYFNNGEIDMRDNAGGELGVFNARELALGGTYSAQLGPHLSLGLTLKWIYSNLSGNVAGTAGGYSVKPASTAAGDIGLYYQRGFKDDVSGREFSYGLGLMMSNFGGKINYGGDSYFIPTNLKLGGRVTYSGDGVHKFNLLLDLNKLMAPTPPKMEAYLEDGVTKYRVVSGRALGNLGLMPGVFGSFSDAPDGFREEINEFVLSTGLEYWYSEMLAARVGYQGQSVRKLGHSNLTAGLGARFKKKFAVDFAYLFPLRQGSPLAQTWRITLGIALNKATDVVEE